MYSIADYGAMIADGVRMDAFDRALRRSVTADSIVVDIGTGTGIFALLACRAGARRVYAIEPDDAIQVAREIAAANGYAARIQFIQAKSTDVTLPERADVIVSDIGGILPWFRSHIPAIVDARRRFLAPGGTLVPARDAVWAAVAEAPELYARHTGPWRDRSMGFDMEAARKIVVNSIDKGRVRPEQLLTRTQRWATVDYAQIEEVNVRARVRCTVERSGTGHGFVAGFDRVVAQDIELSNAPGAPDAVRPERIYGTLFFPWTAPIALDRGDVVDLGIDATLVGDDYVWTWTTSVAAGGNAARTTQMFTQSTFHGKPLSAGRLRKRAATYRPVLNEDGGIARFVLEAIEEGLPLGTIAERLSARFPNRFAGPVDALHLVADLCQQYAGDDR